MSVYSFREAGTLKLTKFELGGKGFGLVEMYKIGIPVPYGFIIPTEYCRKYFRDGKRISEEVKKKVIEKMKELENIAGKRFGDPENPLLVSVRSGAPFSMPGMMDTILNLGINDNIVDGLAKITSNPRFAYEIYSRLIYSFGKIIFKINPEKFDDAFRKIKEELHNKGFDESSPEFWKRVVEAYKSVLNEYGISFPQDPYDQLFKAIAAVFESWYNPRAILYRKIYNISDELGTSATVMQMVYGNLNEKSATGVIFTRNPSSGVKELYGEYLVRAQGEELVSGVRTPRPISELKKEMPEIYKQLEEVAHKLEKYFKDMQDIEFTVEDGKLYILQTRSGKRTPQAAIKIAVDMVEEGLISEEEAIDRIDPLQIKQMLHKRVSPNVNIKPIARGLAASPGVAIGKVVFRIKDAIMSREKGESVILVRPETTPEDIAGVAASEGLLTTKGGLTSHAAVVTRGLGKPCVVGCESIKIDFESESFIVGDKVVRKGEVISIDGNTGNIYLGEVPVEEPQILEEVNKMLLFSDKIRRLKILAIIRDPLTAYKASLVNPDGFIYMNIEDIFIKQAESFFKFLESNFRDTFLYESIVESAKNEIRNMLNALKEKPVFIKLASEPISEILPSCSISIGELARKCPHFNLKGVRLMLNMPQFYEIQLEAIFRATMELGKKVNIILLLPFVNASGEILAAYEIIKRVAEKTGFSGAMSSYSIGVILQTVRSLLAFKEIIGNADFALLDFDEIISSIYSFSRYELRGGIISEYVKRGIFSYDPYEKIEFGLIKPLYNIILECKENADTKIKLGVFTSAPITYNLIKEIVDLKFDYLVVGADDIISAKIYSAKAATKKTKEAIEHTA
ncbi:MAG: pyruvate, phosphate dikinase [Candidatus Bathyarchaeia archaeon]